MKSSEKPTSASDKLGDLIACLIQVIARAATSQEAVRKIVGNGKTNLNAFNIRKRTGERDRLPLSPHLFRSCAATSVAIRAPGSVDIISVILTHSSPMPGERYYNLANSLEASRAHNAMLDELRGELLRKVRGCHSSARGSTREDGSEPPRTHSGHHVEEEQPPCAQ